MHNQLGTDLRSTRQDRFAWLRATDRPLTACELLLASDIELALGNTRRDELLSWRAHLVRCGASA